MRTTLEVLRAARALLALPGRWAKGGLFKKDGAWATSFEEANSFCSLGAIRAITRDVKGMRADTSAAVCALADVLRTRMPHPYRYCAGNPDIDVVALYNDADAVGLDDVINAFDTAIENEKRAMPEEVPAVIEAPAEVREEVCV